MEVSKADKGKVYVCDMDDLCDATISTLYILEEVKTKYPEFKCTLFTIPARCSPKTIEAAKKLGDWLQLAPHGYFHTKGECLAWTEEEAIDKITLAKEMGIDAPIFKAPAWLLDAEVYGACAELGYVVAAHKDFRIPRSGRQLFGDVKEYVYNSPLLRLKWTRGMHGHLSHVLDNYIGDMWGDGRLSFRSGAKFIHCHEAYVIEGSREVANVEA